VLTTERIHRLDEDGDLPALHVTPYDTVSALEYLQLAVGPSLQLNAGAPNPQIVSVSGLTLSATRPGCAGLDAMSDHPTVRLHLAGPASIIVESQRSGALSFQLATSGTIGPARVFELTGGQPVALNINAPGTDAILEVPPQGVTELCGVSAPSASAPGR